MLLKSNKMHYICTRLESNEDKKNLDDNLLVAN